MTLERLTRRAPSAEQLVRESEVSASDVSRVNRLWRRVIPGPLRALLEARAEPSQPPSDDTGPT